MSDADRTGPYLPGPPEPPPGPTVGRFVLGAELGRGAFGVVHRAYDPVLGRDVAVKLPTAADVPAELIERFTREARAAAGLRHPHVVTVFDVGVDAGRPFIAMELVDGPTLTERLAERRTHRQAAEWGRDLALALHCAHTAGVVHRDVKPGNVLVDGGGRVRLTDFGISKLTPSGPTADESAPAATRDGTIMGSPGYMSPEQARGDVSAVGPASDQYSLGVVLYELLTGRRPYMGSGGAVMRQTADPAASPPAPRDLAPDVPLELEAVLLKAINKEPAERYPTAADLAVDLQRWLKGSAVSAPLRLRGEAVRICPDCDQPTKGARLQCRLCGRELADVPATDSADLPPRPPKAERLLALPEGASAAGLSAVRTGLGLIGVRVSFAVWAVGLLTLSGLLTYLVGDSAKVGPRYVAVAPAGVAVVLLAVGQLLELAGLGFCLRAPAASGCRAMTAASIVCQLAGPLLSGTGLYLVTGPARAEIIPIWPAKEPEPVYGDRMYPGAPRRQVGMTKFEPATGPAVWVVCLVVGSLLGFAGWAASVDLLGRLGGYLGLHEVEGQPWRILVMGVVVAIGPSLLLYLGSKLLVPGAYLWFVVLVAVAGLALLITMLLTWRGVLDDLRHELRRRVRDGFGSDSAT